MTTTNLGAMFKLFAIAWGDPTAAWAGTVANGSMRADFRTVWRALELPAGPIDAFFDELAPYEGRDADEVLHELRQDWSHLFLGENARVANSEGVWRKKREGKTQVARMINTYSLEVQQFMRECGVTRAGAYNDCVDYLSNECDFCAFLANRPAYLVELERDPGELLERFLAEHVALWAPGFCEDVAAQARTPFFRALADLTAAFVGEAVE